MKKSFSVALIAAALVAAAFGVWMFNHATRNTEHGTSVVAQETEKAVLVSEPISILPFVSLKQSNAAWATAKSASKIPGRALAGVVNHHVLAADLIAHFFLTLKASQPGIKRFVVISPDHFKQGSSPVSTHDRPYDTPDGMVQIDTSATQVLVMSGSANFENGAMFEREHGVGALMPFLKHEFPAATVVPIAVRGTMDKQRARAFGQELSIIVDDKTFVIISSDMSHYLTEDAALKNDVTTMEKLGELDEKFFILAKDDHIDNGTALVILMGLFDAEKIKPSFQLISHSISSHYGGDKNYTTSYITGVWSEQK